MKLRHLVPTAAVLTLLSTSSALAGPLTLTCAPGQRAVVRETLVRGEPVTSAECVNTTASRALLTSSYQETRYRTAYRTARPHRSWAKTALTIAGGGATGAGIGGIVNGKKGALIGTALGAGAASLYESVKRR
jgi:hypothetical protein